MNEIETQNHPASEPALEKKSFFHFWRCFWLTFLVASLAYAWYCFYAPPNNVAWAASYDEAQQEAAQDGKPIVLFFTGNWCVPCRIMKRNVWADEQVAAAVNAEFVPVMISVDDPMVGETLSRFNVNVTPKTIVTDSQGRVLSQKDGGMGKAEFLEMLGKTNPMAGEDDQQDALMSTKEGTMD